MYILGMLVVIFFVVIVVLGLIYWTHQLHIGLKSDRIVFLPTDLTKVDKHLLGIIPKYITKTEEYDLVELGCGNAGVLRFLYSNFKWNKVIGVELDFVSLVIAKLFSIGKNIEIVSGDIHTYKLAQKSVVYCFLGSEILDQLYKDKQFENHLVICLEFPITGLEPVETNILEGFSIEKQIFVYDFRK